jgi:hypothetical protein
MTTKSVPGPLGDRTVVVVHSMGFELPPHLKHVTPAYEERFLCAILSLLRQPQGRVVYLTSLPMLPRLVDYYFDLAPKLQQHDLKDRLRLISVGDGSSKTLTRKIVERPRLIERIRASIPDPRRALILPYITGPDELALGAALDVPVYGHDPALAWLGTKTGSRRVFADQGVPHAPGVDGVATVADVVEAIRSLGAAADGSYIVKLDQSAGGLGNGTVRLLGASSPKEIEARVRAIELDDPGDTVENYFAALERQGGVVETRLDGEEVRSPSVQGRVDPEGRVEILSTHDQMLGGSNGLTFLGCRFPADPAYVRDITHRAGEVAKRLAKEGALGRFSVDFVSVRTGERWDSYAIEVNLRSGGTTHPTLTLLSLTDGDYHPDAGEFVTPDGHTKHYVASDHVEAAGYERLTPDDLLDLAQGELSWDEESMSGVVFHMVSAIAAAGRTGVTVIGDTAAEAEQSYERVVRTLDREGRARS